MEANQPVLEVHQLTKTYRSGESQLTVLRQVSFSLAAGATCAIVGPSGSGKTTLLGLCAGLDRATSGSVRLAGIALDDLDEDARARVRNEHTGFVFQNFQLVPTLTALENVMVPAELRGARRKTARRAPVLPAPSRTTRANSCDKSASNAERIIIPRSSPAANSSAWHWRGRSSTVRGCSLPTSPPATSTARRATASWISCSDLNSQAGTALVLVTHNLELAARTGRIIRLRDGAMVD